ncbi:hypothetical protein HHI36_023564 [Cryptolaemus montrouzieri]|uniref:Uncharacterized protein n=1 Tax=Cryptolaemus montrouzieri TaxID=559131 RepID=A0ABD2PGY3_9CUCU
MQVNLVGDKYETETIFNENFDVSNLLTIIVCDNEPFENIVDLSKFAMGHYFKIPEANGSEHYHICDQRHDVQKCYMEVKQKISLGNVSRTNQGTSSKQEQTNKSESLKPLPIDDVKHNETVEIVNHPKQEITQQTLKIITKPEGKTSTEMDSKKKCEHEQEKEIMRKAKENINRKTRPLMKYSDDSDDLLRIDKHDNVNNWEDLFDDNGQIQDELLTEIVHKVGNDMTIVKASEDYTPYMRKHTEEDMEHVVEIYDFPPSLNTGDIILAFSMFDSDSMYVIWIDHTHALLVLGSSSQAQKAMEVKHPLIKMRPMSNASTIAMATARQYDLKPAMKRPPTNLQTARRLITNHLGTKSQVTKEQTAREREQMRQAREKRNITKRNEKDAWEGNVRSSMRQ